ncbi:MAG TPA: hypothetical protein DCF63_01750 [Planctomycetaceae bacterium]|nr:hypothetical protein [Planctomycetaceae bacterium]
MKILVITLVLFCLRLTPASASESTAEYYRRVSSLPWQWNEAEIGPFASLERVSQQHTKRKPRVHILPRRKNDWLFSILLGEKLIYKWRGHSNSVFCLANDRLLIVDYRYNSPNGEIVAVDTVNGNEVWRKRLQADLTKYSNGYSMYDSQFDIEIQGDIVITWSKQSFGRYVEFKNIENGETLAYKIFTAEPEELNLDYWTPRHWNASNDGLTHCLSLGKASEYRINISPQTDTSKLRKLSVSKNGRPIIAWEAHESSEFVLNEDSLYFVEFFASQSAPNIVCVDLKTGRKNWQQTLVTWEKSGEPVDCEFVRMKLRYSLQVLYVERLQEDAARLDVVRLDNGKTIAHRELPVVPDSKVQK